MKITKERLKELLVRPGYIGEADFELAAIESEKRKIPIERLLAENGLMPDKHLGTIIADGLNYHFIDLRTVKITDDLLTLIPEVVARSQQAIVFERTKDKIKLATPHPDNYEFIKLLERRAGNEVETYYATSLGVAEALKYYKSDVGKEAENLTRDLAAHPELEENVVKLVDLFLEHAYDSRASDIHIEPLEKNVLVRFRVDGVLHEVVTYPKNLHNKIVFRIKIMSKLRTDEHAAAQDGRFDYQKGGVRFDVRVSIMPVTDGENVVMRLLSERSRRLTLEGLGLLGKDMEKVRRAASRSYGMILSAGPTGSGKTTTLYAILQILNRPEVNIMTIEDPVEYGVEHVQQTQVNAKKNLTFATGLRSLVRQDPDIIMVGEIRDEETAAIAINAAMTGHLLLSTLHANDAATTFPRLIDMGVEPFLIASAVNLVAAQRLVRKICEKCRASYYLSEEETRMLKADPLIAEVTEEIYGEIDFSKIRFYKGAGCKVCGETGYSGRTGIFELMEIGNELRALITEKATADVIARTAKGLGMTSMLHDGMNKVIGGITTLDEVIRATKI